MPMNSTILQTIAAGCQGLCDECKRSDICEQYRAFMFDACRDWEDHQVEEIMVLFDDPDCESKMTGKGVI